MELNFIDRIKKKNLQTSNFTKNRPVGAELFRVEADMTKLIVAFRKSAQGPKNIVESCVRDW